MIAEEGRGGDGCYALGLGANGKWFAQRVQCGKVKAKLGRRFKRAFVFVKSFRGSEGGVCFLVKEFEAENFQ